MRTTIDLEPALHEAVRRQALRQNLSMARLLGRLVEQGLKAATEQPPSTLQSGRFTVIAPAEGAAGVSSEQLQKLIDEEGIL